MLILLASVLLGGSHVGDGSPIFDPDHEVAKLDRTSAVIEYSTEKAVESRIEIREGAQPRAAWKSAHSEPVRIVASGTGRSLVHRVGITGLQPGKRYYYRIYDPSASPTEKEVSWGASGGFTRERAFSTLAPKGRKTIIQLPVKVLLMPDVVNVESAYANPDQIAPEPTRITAAQITKIKSEYALSARYLWVNSGMRLWVDYEFFVDERWQRWGNEPASASSFFKGLPVCRSYSGVDFAAPGGGGFTILDTKNPGTSTSTPVVEDRPYSHQIEMAWPRKWNARSKEWEFYSSGGGTYGLDDLPKGVPGRSQFLAGGDTAWLATHELHHQLESASSLFLDDAEDDRIAFNHPAPRKRTLRGDQTYDENSWTTSGRHGEHWDAMAFWDRKLCDVQWLRCMFGRTETVADADEDGVPDNDPRLPLDEKRFGSDPKKLSSDGSMGDLAKIMLSTWAPGPLQSSWVRPGANGLRMPAANRVDSNGLGVPDALSRNPLVPFSSIIPFKTIELDGEFSDWADLPVSGKSELVTYKHAHDDARFYLMMELKTSWKSAHVVIDGEGLGAYSGQGVIGFDLVNNLTNRVGAGPRGVPFEIKSSFGNIAPLKWKFKKTETGLLIEMSYPNGADGTWYWSKGGREIGVNVSITNEQDQAFALWQPYTPFWCRMAGSRGAAPVTALAITPFAKRTPYEVGNSKVKPGLGWVQEGRSWKHSGAESPLLIDGLALKEFDLEVVCEVAGDVAIGILTRLNKPLSNEGFGLNNQRLRLNGTELEGSSKRLSAGRHTLRISRREAGWQYWIDGVVLRSAPDPAPKAVFDRVGVFGVNLRVHSITLGQP